jgi:hypothetical protein
MLTDRQLERVAECCVIALDDCRDYPDAWNGPHTPEYFRQRLAEVRAEQRCRDVGGKK